MKVSYDWLQDYIGETKLSAEEVAELLGMHAFELEEVERIGDDAVIDVDILPNRASDCLSHRGIAREIASITGTPLNNDPLRTETSLTDIESIDITIEDKEACPRFSASLLTDVTVKDSPDWLKKRLEAIGQRSINNIVDATNYVMFALGQPIHAYDADLFPQVDGRWKFDVRFAKAGETVSLIPESGKNEARVVECQGTELLIVDGSSNTPIGLAGVKGGSFAGMHGGTNKVIIETAHFHPTITRKTARRLGIVIDASKRFENEPSRELVPYTQQAVCDLIVEIAEATYEGTADVYLEKKNNPEVIVSVERTNTLLGLQLEASQIKDILERIGATVTEVDGGFKVVGPWERTDLNLQEDFIEEVGRIHGYKHIQAITPNPAPLKELNKRHYYSELIRSVLIAEGFSEVITSSFRKKDQVQLLNALASDKSYLRSSLIKNISDALDRNAGFTDLLGTNDTRIFEIGTVFYKEGRELKEHVALTIGVRIKSSGYSGKEDKIISHIQSSLEEKLGVAVEGEVEKGVLEVNLTALLENLPNPEAYQTVEVGNEASYKPFSIYPHMSRDIAMWVPEGTDPVVVAAVLNEHAGDLRVRTTQFDEFTKDGRTSLGFRLVFQSVNRTLTDEEVNALMENVYSEVAKNGWETR